MRSPKLRHSLATACLNSTIVVVEEEPRRTGLCFSFASSFLTHPITKQIQSCRAHRRPSSTSPGHTSPIRRFACIFTNKKTTSSLASLYKASALVAHISRHSKTHRVQSLVLEGNEITDDGVTAIVRNIGLFSSVFTSTFSRVSGPASCHQPVDRPAQPRIQRHHSRRMRYTGSRPAHEHVAHGAEPVVQPNRRRGLLRAFRVDQEQRRHSRISC